MTTSSRTARAALKKLALASAAAVGREAETRAWLGRAGEARLMMDPAARRELRDNRAALIVLTTVLREDSSAIDVGANVGAVLKSIVRLAPSGRHIAYEPVPELHEALRERFPAVDVRCAALSDVAGETEFSHVVGAPAYSGLRERADLPAGADRVQRIPVRTERLDDVLEEDYVPALIKIDVEGAEVEVLRGAVRTLERHRPFVLFEHGSGGADLYGHGPQEVYDLLEGAGMRIFDLDGTGPYSREQFQATFTEPIWNFLAAPR
jgi:FkbM family methyltransferase